MNIELKKQRNDLLKRTNILAKITSITTPGRKEVLLKVAAMLGVDEQLIVIDNIEQNFGEHNSLAYIKVYDDIKTLKELESGFKLKRTGLEEKKEEVKEDVKEAEPVAEKKEEVKEEVKESEPVVAEKKEEVKEEVKESEPVVAEKKEEVKEEVKEAEPVVAEKKEEVKEEVKEAEPVVAEKKEEVKEE